MLRIDDREWGGDEWLLDRAARRRWLRSIALHRLAEQILRTPAGPAAAVACLLDEILTGAMPLSATKIARCVREDVTRFESWLRDGITKAGPKASRGASRFKTWVVILPDGPPYNLQLALASAQPHEDEWAQSITWQSSAGLALALLDQLLPRTKRLSASIRRDADYIVPLAYSAFVFCHALRNARTSKQPSRRGAMVSYHGGDTMIVPLAQSESSQRGARRRS